MLFKPAARLILTGYLRHMYAATNVYYNSDGIEAAFNTRALLFLRQRHKLLLRRPKSPGKTFFYLVKAGHLGVKMVIWSDLKTHPYRMGLSPPKAIAPTLPKGIMTDKETSKGPALCATFVQAMTFTSDMTLSLVTIAAASANNSTKTQVFL